MSRWNIKDIVYYSHDGRKRELNLDRESVNIITGASNTGKTAIIKTIDYCLGSTSCNIPSFIKDRVSHVSVKWSDETTELLVSRAVPCPTNTTTRKMYIEYGSTVSIPKSPDLLKGKTQRDQARLVIERLFGIGEAYQENNSTSGTKNRISVRQATPYMFLTKGVIDSETALLHGLDDREAAKHIIGAIPFFLGAVDQEEIETENRLKQLTKAVEYEEKKQSAFEKSTEDIITKCHSLIREAMQCGITPHVDLTNNIEELHPTLRAIANWQPLKIVFPNNEEMRSLSRQKSDAYDSLNKLRRKRKAAERMSKTAAEFTEVVERQLSKINAAEFFNPTAAVETCPVCSSHLSETTNVSRAIKSAFNELSREKQVVRKHRPALGTYTGNLDNTIFEQQKIIEKFDQQIRALVAESDSAKEQQNTDQRASRVAGRVSFFLDSFQRPEDYDTEKLNAYLEEITDLEERLDKNHKEEKLRIAENLISNYASDIFAELPKGEPCNSGRMQFFSKKPSVIVYDHEINREHRFEDIGSDENYLSLHIALIFGLQRFLEEAKRPVPGVVILDQVSRPYFPQEDDSDEIELSSDDDTTALRQYFNFLFSEVSKRSGLQVIVLEHAYFKDDDKFRDAVKYRWPKNSIEKLIPSEWPVRI